MVNEFFLYTYTKYMPYTYLLYKPNKREFLLRCKKPKKYFAESKIVFHGHCMYFLLLKFP